MEGETVLCILWRQVHSKVDIYGTGDDLVLIEKDNSCKSTQFNTMREISFLKAFEKKDNLSTDKQHTPTSILGKYLRLYCLLCTSIGKENETDRMQPKQINISSERTANKQFIFNGNPNVNFDRKLKLYFHSHKRHTSQELWLGVQPSCDSCVGLNFSLMSLLLILCIFLFPFIHITLSTHALVIRSMNLSSFSFRWKIEAT